MTSVSFSRALQLIWRKKSLLYFTFLTVKLLSNNYSVIFPYKLTIHAAQCIFDVKAPKKQKHQKWYFFFTIVPTFCEIFFLVFEITKNNSSWRLEIGTIISELQFTKQTRQILGFRLSLQLGTHMHWLHSPNLQIPSFFACFYARNSAFL